MLSSPPLKVRANQPPVASGVWPLPSPRAPTKLFCTRSSFRPVPLWNPSPRSLQGSSSGFRTCNSTCAHLGVFLLPEQLYFQQTARTHLSFVVVGG